MLSTLCPFSEAGPTQDLLPVSGSRVWVAGSEFAPMNATVLPSISRRNEASSQSGV